VIKTTRQSGVVLIVSLFMLLLLTLIGLSGMQTTSLEEKMASNNRDQNLAFQSAEAALRGGEDIVRNTTNKDDFNGVGGLLSRASNEPVYNVASTWSDNNSAEFVSGISSDLISTEPRYWIKYVKDVSDDINISNNNQKWTSYFIVTARGTGVQDTSRVFLRSSYAKKF